MATARAIVAGEGADALTLGRLAERAGVSKPVVYDHFESRSAVLMALYRDFDRRQKDALNIALARTPPSVRARVERIAESYVACAVSEGTELGGVASAVAGSPAMAKIRRESERDYIAICRRSLAEAADGRVLDDATAVAFLGAAEALSSAVLAGEVNSVQATTALVTLLMALTEPPSTAID